MPKGHRGIPSWNFSLVLHQLTKTEELQGLKCVAPMIISCGANLQLTNPLKRTGLCPSRALYYNLDKTKDLRQVRQFTFISLKINCAKDISPATISSWINNTDNDSLL